MSKPETERAYYFANRERRLAANKTWREANADRVKAQRDARLAARDKTKAAAVWAEWKRQNAARYAETRATWVAANKGRIAKYTVDRKAAILRATPKWADPERILEIYERAAWMRSIGLDVHVDHVIPLRGRTVCGLHVHTNLDIVEARENLQKHNKLVSQ